MRARSARITQFPVFLPSPILGEGLGVGDFKKALVKPLPILDRAGGLYYNSI
jgi:hypothetical protein